MGEVEGVGGGAHGSLDHHEVPGEDGSELFGFARDKDVVASEEGADLFAEAEADGGLEIEASL